MSVRTGERGETKLEVLTLCMNLASYTAQKVSKDKLFPKSSRWMIPKRLMDAALDAVQCISFANSIYVSNKMTASMRLCREQEAKGHLKSMLTLIDLAYNLYPNLDDRVVENWTGLILDTLDALEKWIESDKKRYDTMPVY